MTNDVKGSVMVLRLVNAAMISASADVADRQVPSAGLVVSLSLSCCLITCHTSWQKNVLSNL